MNQSITYRRLVRTSLLFLLATAWISGCASHRALPIPEGHTGLQLHPLFKSHAVLQQGMEIPVQGTDVPNQEIRIIFHEKTYRGRADSNGEWEVPVPSGNAGGPYHVTIRGSRDIELDDVLVGEVWLCGGQSNMAWPLSRTQNAESAIAASHDSQIRLLSIPRRVSDQPLDDFDNASWQICEPDTAKDFSAVGYYFGKSLRAELDVPIGLISSNWGGTRVQAWIPPNAADESDMFRAVVDENEAQKKMTDQPNRPKQQNMPSVLFNGMIAPLTDYPIRGVIWYQGEANTRNVSEALAYRHYFPLMIDHWRRQWQQTGMPFLFVQLAPFKRAAPNSSIETWPILRESQLVTSQNTAQTAMAIITDVGECDNIHPKNKETVGERLALLAREMVYDQTIVANGPVLDKLKIDGNEARLSFESTGTGLQTSDEKPLRGFEIADNEREFLSAKAEIDGHTVRVWSDEIDSPVAVRYGWSDCPDLNLINSEGLPASPFRSDNWEFAE